MDGPRTRPDYDSILIVGFGGPEGPEDVMPFLENVTRGRNIPRERLLEVAEHYHHFGGVSPINAQVRELIAALRAELDRRGITLPIYWGNRNWHPMLAGYARGDDRRRAANRRWRLVLAAYSSYSSCRQYREDIERARASAGADAPRSTRSGSSTTTHSSSRPMPTASARPWTRSAPATGRPRPISRSRPTASRSRWRGMRLRTSANRDLPPGRRGRRRRARAAGGSSIRAGAAVRRIPGSSRISWIISGT